MAAGMVPPAAGIVVVDEADSLLQTQVAFFGMFLPAEVDKGWVNDFLDHSKAHTVWITNETAGIPESTLRRFTYSIRFARFTRKQRERCFRLALEGAGLAGALSPDELAELSARYPVSAAGIAQAVDACRKVMGEDQTTSTHRDVRLLLEEFLVRHVEVTGVRKEEVHLPTSRYDLSALNTDCDPNALLASAREFVKTPAWGNAPDAPPFNLLFWGPPGTGKTEFARYLSSQLGLELHVRRASDLLDKYVGNSEKLIREAFLEAQQAHAILMIDEADSLLSRREGAIHSWEVSQVNELLSAMENHKGILVCSTNFLHNLDRAALRRFAWKVEFKPLAASCRRRLYDRHFTGIIGEGLPDHGASRLEAILGLTFGDYAAVLIRVRFLPRSQVTHDVLLAMLEKEAKYRDERTGNRVGFKS
jgi:SpoVK/Ycf46/Vps4 family AAA+-type ATPase